MLTKPEREMIIWIYSLVCRFCTIPFKWKANGMLLKQNYGVKYWYYLTWTLLLVTLIFELLHFPVMIRKNNLSMVVLHGSAIVGHIVLTISKLNVWMHRSEIVQLINQVFYINTFWGMNSIKGLSL